MLCQEIFTEPPKDHKGADSNVVTLGSLYSSYSLVHTTVSDAAEPEGLL